jgi:integrase
MPSNQRLVEVATMPDHSLDSDDDMPLVSGMTAEDSEVMPEHGTSCDDSDSSVWNDIGPDFLNEDATLAHAEEYEAEVQRIIGDAAQFEETARTRSYAESTILEFRRIWNRFITFLRESTIGSGFLNDDNTPSLPLQKLPCILFIRAITLARRVEAVDGTLRYLGSGSINNAVAALKYFGFPDQSVPLDILRFFHNASKSQARLVARERFFNRHPVPSQGLPWKCIKRILAYARPHDPDLHCYLLNLVQSMCRGERVSNEGWACFDWVEDHLTCMLQTSKCDQAGKHSYSKQFFFSYDVDLCLVTALGKKLLTTPPENAGPFVYKSNIRNTECGPVQTFERRLKALLRSMVASGDVFEYEFGVQLDTITLHSLKRSAYRFLRNFPVPPSAIKFRAEHRSGMEHTYAGRDEGPNPSDDATMGRVLAGLLHCTDQFYVVPPHFSRQSASMIDYDRIVPMYLPMQNPTNASTKIRFNNVLPYLMAAVLHHYHCSDQGLLRLDKLFQSPMWTTQVAYRNHLYNRLQGAGRSSSSISITGHNREHDHFMMMREMHTKNDAILKALLQFQPTAIPKDASIGSSEAFQPTAIPKDASIGSSEALSERCSEAAFRIQSPSMYSATDMLGQGKQLQSARTSEMIIPGICLCDLFSRYFVGRQPLRLLNSSDIPRHWSGTQKAHQRSLISKAKFVFTGLLGQTEPACIDGNNACRVYEKLKDNVTMKYGEVITQGTLRTTYNKMRANMEAYRECCNAPPITLNPPRQRLLEDCVEFVQPTDSNENILEIDDYEQTLHEEDVTKCFLCPYCDEDILNVYKTRKTLLEHVRTGHTDCQPPPSNIVKIVDAQKHGLSTNARWIRVQNAVGHIPAVVETQSTYKPANLASTILDKGEVRSGSFVQVFNASKDLWFALVADGRILGKGTDSPHLISACWCKPNSLDVDLSRKRDKIFLASIIAMGDHDTMTKTFKLHSNTPVKPSKTACPIPGRILDYFSPVRSNEQRWVSGASCSAELKVQSAVAEVVEDQSNALTLVVGSSSIDTATPTAIWLEKNMIEPHRHFQLHANDMRVLSNRGGGDCLFRALRQGLRNIACDGQKLDHIELRQKIVDHARSNLDQTLNTSSGTLCLKKNVTMPL